MILPFGQFLTQTSAKYPRSSREKLKDAQSLTLKQQRQENYTQIICKLTNVNSSTLKNTAHLVASSMESRLDISKFLGKRCPFS